MNGTHDRLRELGHGRDLRLGLLVREHVLVRPPVTRGRGGLVPLLVTLDMPHSDERFDHDFLRELLARLAGVVVQSVQQLTAGSCPTPLKKRSGGSASKCASRG